MKKLLIIPIVLFIALGLDAQKKKKYETKVWSEIDFMDRYKGKMKVNGRAGKDFKKHPTFIADYSIHQATIMKGSQKTATTAVYSEVQFGGISEEAMKQAVAEMHEELVKELKKIGLNIVDGNKIIQSDYARKKADDNKAIVGKNYPNPRSDKASVLEGMLPFFPNLAVKQAQVFRPENKVVYNTNKTVAGNFHPKLAQKEEVNLIMIEYYVTFAYFDGGRGYKSVNLNTSPLMAIKPSITMYTPGSWPTFYISKQIQGNGGWDEGLFKASDNQATAEFLGLARSAEYVLAVKEEAYLEELKDILSNFQKQFSAAIKEEL